MTTEHNCIISVAVIEAQAVLELVAGGLDTETPLEPEHAFTLFSTWRAAIARLDAVHDVLQATVGNPVPLVAKAPGAVQ